MKFSGSIHAKINGKPLFLAPIAGDIGVSPFDSPSKTSNFGAILYCSFLFSMTSMIHTGPCLFAGWLMMVEVVNNGYIMGSLLYSQFLGSCPGAAA